MNITFFIGNGFDLNVGLKTGYKHFYDYLIKKEPNNKLVKSIKKDYELWADLELGLGDYLKNVNSDEEVDEFLDSKELIESNLIEYLKEENSFVSYHNQQKIAESFQNGIVDFYKSFSPKEQVHYKSITSVVQEISYNFIDFNYTTVLDSLVSITQKYCNPFNKHTYQSTTYNDNIVKPLHIHGDIGGGMILGVNDLSQIKNEKLRTNPDIVDCMLKKNLNEDAGCFRIRDAQTIINNSMYICVYGMSIGDTDDMWWRLIINWLTQNKSRRLVLFVKDDTKVASSAGAQTRYSKKRRKLFINHGIDISDDILNKVSNQITIIPNSKIFDIDGLSIKRTEGIVVTKNNNVNNLFADNNINSIQQTATKFVGKEKEILEMSNNVVKSITGE